MIVDKALLEHYRDLIDGFVRQIELLTKLLVSEKTTIPRPVSEGQTAPWAESCAFLEVAWLPDMVNIKGLGLIIGLFDEGVIALKNGKEIVVDYHDCDPRVAEKVRNVLKKQLKDPSGLYLKNGFDVHTAERTELINACQVNGICQFNPGGQPMAFNRMFVVASGSGSNIRVATFGARTPHRHSDWLESDDDLRSALIAHMNDRWRIHHFGVRHKRTHDGWSNKETGAVYDLIVNCAQAYWRLNAFVNRRIKITASRAKELFGVCQEPLDPDYYDLDREINWGEIADNLKESYAPAT